VRSVVLLWSVVGRASLPAMVVTPVSRRVEARLDIAYRGDMAISTNRMRRGKQFHGELRLSKGLKSRTCSTAGLEKCRARPNSLAPWRTRLPATEIASCHLLCIRHPSIRGTSTTEKHRMIDSRLRTASIIPRRPAIALRSPRAAATIFKLSAE
jgi:hypothetical protein